MVLKQIGWEGMGWTDLTEVRDKLGAIVHTVMRLWVVENAGNLLTG